MTSKMITNIIDPLLSGYLSGMVPTECAHIKVSPLYKAVWKITSRLRIVMISSGICRINMNKNEYVLYRNDMLIMFSGYEYKIQSEGEDSTELWWIDITGLGVDGFLSMLSLSEQNCYIQGISNPSCLRELMNIVLYCGDMTRSDILNSIGGMYKMLAVLVDECTHPEWTIVPHDSQSIIYTGNWTAWPSKISTEHNEYYTNMKCAYAELNFYGNRNKMVWDDELRLR